MSFTHTLWDQRRKKLFLSYFFTIDWNISINIHLSLSQNWSRSCSALTQKDPTDSFFQKEIPGLKIFLFISFSRKRNTTSAIRRLFSSINYELFRVINISICTRESYITESDMVQMKIYTFKRRHGEESCLVSVVSNLWQWIYFLKASEGRKREEDNIMDLFWWNFISFWLITVHQIIKRDN